MNWRKDITIIRYSITILPLAEEDIKGYTDYIAFELKSPKRAIDTAKGLKDTINKLAIFPKRHALDEDEILASYGIRKAYYKNYKIYFLINEHMKNIYILRVFHMLNDDKGKIIKIFSQ